MPYSILRCGSHTEDVFDPRIEMLNKGILLFPDNASVSLSDCLVDARDETFDTINDYGAAIYVPARRDS